MKYLLSVLFLLYSSQVIYAQETAETLNDSARNVYKEDPQKAILIVEQALLKAKQENNLEEINVSKNTLGVIYRDLGEFEKAKKFSLEALSKAKDSIVMASCYNNIGACNRSLGLYEDAIKFYLKALTIYENKSIISMQATVQNNIGMVYSYSGINDKAIEYHLKAKKTFEELNNQKGISEVYNNIAIIYANEGDLEKALEYFKFSLTIEESLNDKKGIAESTNNVGAVYYYMQEIDSALVYFNQSATIEKSIGNYAGVGSSYNNIADVLIENDRISEAKVYIDTAYFYANKYKVTDNIEAALHNYSRYFEVKNDSKSALNYYKKFTIFRDSILNIETNSKIAELEIEFQTQKKEKKILTQKSDLVQQELDLSKKNTYILSLVALAVVLFLLGYLFYNHQKLKNKQLQKENLLKDALLKIETQNRLQEQRLHISRDLHDNIGAQLTFIISSLDNLKYGFKLPDNLNNKLMTISAFTIETIYELRDTIWAMNKSEISFEDLQSRTSNFIEKADLASHQVSFNFSIDEDLKRTEKFTSVEGMNIYRIIQESINNAIKYAEAKSIEVLFQNVDDKLCITIKDDGKGFDSSTVEMGNGLSNMKKRANEIGAILDIKSSENKGTIISLEIP